MIEIMIEIVIEIVIEISERSRMKHTINVLKTSMVNQSLKNGFEWFAREGLVLAKGIPRGLADLHIVHHATIRQEVFTWFNRTILSLTQPPFSYKELLTKLLHGLSVYSHNRIYFYGVHILDNLLNLRDKPSLVWLKHTLNGPAFLVLDNANNGMQGQNVLAGFIQTRIMKITAILLSSQNVSPIGQWQE